MDCPDDNGKVAMPAIGHSYMLDPNKGDGKGYTIEFRRVEAVEKTEMIDENGDIYYTQEEIVVKGIAKVTFYLICQGFADWGTWTPCNHTAEVTIEFESNTHTEATCTEAETFFYDFTIDDEMLIQAMAEQDTEDTVEDGLSESSFRTLTVNQVAEGTETVGAANALGHTFEKVDAVSPTCEAYGSTAGKKCAVCGLVEDVKEVAPRGHSYEWRDALKATCTAAGHGAGEVCIYCGKEKDGVAHFDPLGHDFTVDISEEAPTCTHVGHTAGKKCSRCDAIEGCDVVDDLGHLEEIIPGKAPTETESGLTDGVRCPRCGEIIKPQEEIEPLGGAAADPDGGPALDTVAWVMIGVGAAALTAAVAVTAVLVIRKKRGD